MLPNIDIAIHDNPISFIKGMEALAQNYETEFHEDVGLLSQRMDAANFRCKTESPHVGLGFQLISHEKSPFRILVEIRASRWASDGFSATREEYVSAARNTVGKLLTKYNRECGSRYRLRISDPQYGSKPTENTLFHLDRFCICANTSTLHHLDWQRFYRFVKASRQVLAEETLSQLLVERGFTVEYAEEISTIYRHLAEYKANFR